MKKLFILVTMAILSASQAVYATGNIQYLRTDLVEMRTTPQADYNGMAVPMISNEPTPYWEFPDAAAQYTITASEGATSDSLHVTFTPIVSGSGCDYDPQEDAYYEGSDFSATAASVEHNTNCEGSCSSGCLVVTCDITFVSGFFPRSTDYFITIEQVREVYNRSFTFTSPQLNARTVFSTTSPPPDPAPGSVVPAPAATRTTTPARDPAFTPAALLPSLPRPETTIDSGDVDSITNSDYTDFAADDGSCQLIAGAIANPFGFIILAMALIPLAWRRRK